MKRSKKYTEALKKFDKNKSYSIEEATKLVKETATAKFDETVELVVKLNVDAKKADQQLRGAIVLPNGTGKTKKILVIAKGAQAKAATEAGADYVGDTDMIEKISKENWFDFDVLVATPDMMPALGKIGKVLGPKGLMPNPKTGTVTMDTAKAVEEVKKGRTEYRTDMYGNVAIVVGKVSFTAKKLAENVTTFINMLEKGKPSSVKGNYIAGTTISCTMGPGIKVDTKAFDTTEE